MTWLLEDSTPAIVLGVLLEALLALVLLKTGRRAALAAMGGVLVLVALAVLVERWVVTDREQLEELFARLAAALAARDADTVLAAIDPAAARVRSDARRVLAAARLDEVTITDLRIALRPRGQPSTAEADLTARASSRPGRGSPASQSVVGRFLIQLRKEQDRWLIESYQEQPLLGKPR